MNNSCTIDLHDELSEIKTPAIGLYDENFMKRVENSCDVYRNVKIAGLFLSLTISSITAMQDPWFFESMRRDATVTAWSYQEVIGHIISRSEALRISRKILEQAERERLEIAEFEATRGIHWEIET